jgi:hypothetical protein
METRSGVGSSLVWGNAGSRTGQDKAKTEQFSASALVQNLTRSLFLVTGGSDQRQRAQGGALMLASVPHADGVNGAAYQNWE